MEVSGKIKMIDQTKEVGTAGFKKRDVVVTTDEQYPQHILIQFVQDKCELLNNFKIGEAVKIDINFRGNIWTNPEGKEVYFNTIQGWRIAKQDTSQHPQPAAKPAASKPAAQTQTNPQQMGGPLPGEEEEEDDLPF